MNYLTLRIWGGVIVSLCVAAAIGCVAPNLTSATSGTARAMNVLLLLGALGSYAFVIRLIVHPNRNPLRHLPGKIGGSLILTAAFASGVIHFIHFIPSPEAGSPLGKVVAILLLMAGGNLYLLVVRIIWRGLSLPQSVAEFQ